MKKILYLIAFALLLLSCSSMTNDEIIKETKKCQDAGLRAVVYENANGDLIIKCKPI